MRAHLTARQREVLLLAANGNTNARIASWLGVTSNSIAETLSVAYRRLGASDRAQAVAIALRLGLLGLDDIVLPGLMAGPQHDLAPQADLPFPAPTAARGRPNSLRGPRSASHPLSVQHSHESENRSQP